MGVDFLLNILSLMVRSNGKVCCNQFTGKCPEILRRNSQSKSNNPYIITPLDSDINKICEYGCNEIAAFQFSNDKVCCSIDPNKCYGKKESAIKTNQIRYGTDNPSQNSEIQERIYIARVKAGSWRSREERRIQSPKIKAYNKIVQMITEKSWKNNQNILNPNNLIRGPDLHLDHIFSLQAGYRKNVPPKVMGHWTNLQLMPGRENESKAQRCNKTLNKLYIDYNRNN